MVLYNGMASTSPCAALYFVALMTFGNYVLFNLLVAILVEGFQAEVIIERNHTLSTTKCTFFETAFFYIIFKVSTLSITFLMLQCLLP